MTIGLCTKILVSKEQDLRDKENQQPTQLYKKQPKPDHLYKLNNIPNIPSMKSNED